MSLFIHLTQKPSRTIALIFFAMYVAGNGPANAIELISNGDFETGNYAGWTRSVQLGSEGNLFIQPNDGGSTPLGLPYQFNIAGGNWFSITDAGLGGPGSYSLTQAFTIAPGSGDINYSFQMFANNWTDPHINAPGRDFSTPALAQNAVVDIIKAGADPFTDAAGDVVKTLFGPGSDPGVNPNPWTTYTGTLSLAPGTYQIRFAETDNVFFFNQGLDNVSISVGVAVPLPVTGAGLPGVVLATVGLLAWWRRKRKHGA